LVEDDYWLECAARAIARHDDNTDRVEFRREPFSYLLILADELQEWGRWVTVGPLPPSGTGMARALTLLAKAELPCITCDFGDSWAFTLDYTSTENTVLRDTGFSFVRFFYDKHRNLARLDAGLPVEIQIRTRRAAGQLKDFIDRSSRKGNSNAARWAQGWLDRAAGDTYRFELGSLRPPPRIAAQID
jgi:hypothetical protein